MQTIDVKAAREYVLANYPLDPLLRTIALNLLEQMPKVDAVEVVRCRDCEYWQEPWLKDQTLGVCQLGKKNLTEPYFFCYCGERRGT